MRSSDDYKEIFNLICDAIVLVDNSNGRILEVNSAAVELYGYSYDELIQMCNTDVSAEPEKTSHATHTYQTKIPVRYHRNKGGKVFPVEINVKHYNWHGANVHLCVIREISQQLAIEAEQRKSSERFKALFDNSGDAIFINNMAGDIIDANLEACHRYGYSREEFLRMHVSDVDDETNIGKIQGRLAKVLAEGRTVFESVHRTKSGNCFPVDVTVRYINFVDECFILSTCRDITDRKLAEEELLKLNSELEERVRERTRLLEYRTVLLEIMSEASIDGILMVDDKGETILFNKRFGEIWGIPQELLDKKNDEKMLGYVVSLLKHPKEFINKVTWLYEHRDQTSRDEIKLVDGRCLDRYSSPLINATGHYLGRTWFFRDITENRKLQEQLQQSKKLESVGRLAGGIAHDFNNKLSVIMGYTELARDELPDTTNVEAYLQEVARAAEFSRDITSQLLAFSRQQIVLPRKVKVNHIVGKTMKSLSSLIGEDIQLNFNLCEDIWTIRIDPVQIDQIIMNLAVNARDAIPHSGVITIETANHCIEDDEAIPKRYPQGDYVMISVSDTGIGMDDDTIKRIFEPFFTTKEVGKGTGLGLATTHGIVSQNDGFIDVESSPECGTIFRVYFPRYEDEALELMEQTESVSAKRSESILLVEDDAAVREMTAIMLERAGYCVTQCATPDKAIQCYEQGATTYFDLIITDIIMPGMNGKEMIERIESITNDFRVLYMSGYSTEIISQKGALAEHTNFIQKPVNAHEMMMKIAEILNR